MSKETKAQLETQLRAVAAKERKVSINKRVVNEVRSIACRR